MSDKNPTAPWPWPLVRWPPVGCVCERCQGTITRMPICSKCGNKRCPGANDHDRECSGSNDVNHPLNAWWAGGARRRHLMADTPDTRRIWVEFEDNPGKLIEVERCEHRMLDPHEFHCERHPDFRPGACSRCIFCPGSPTLAVPDE